MAYPILVRDATDERDRLDRIDAVAV